MMGLAVDPLVFFEGNGHGWKNIQTRLNQIEGDFNIESQPGINGTMMIVNVQLDAQNTSIASNVSEAASSH